MREDVLCSVLLVKAIEESDPEGALLPIAERAAATRDAARTEGAAPGRPARTMLDTRAQNLLARRAFVLRERLSVRFRFIDSVVALARGPAWVGWVLIVAGLTLGIVLSALDGTQRINVLSFPLLGLILWNLAVYLTVAVGWIRSLAGKHRDPSKSARVLLRSGAVRAQRLVEKSARFNAPLAAAMRRFVGEWTEAARGLLIARAVSLFHLCAAAVGIGLVAGLYMRGIALSYQAGWESTFLDAPQVRALLSFFYSPASALTGIPVPDVAHLASIRWERGQGGEGAARWIHLLAATAALFIVLPRLVLASIATQQAWRWSRRAPLPPALDGYFRSVFGVLPGLASGAIAVIPYAYEPSSEAAAELRRRLPAALGSQLRVTVRPVVPYGGEDDIAARLSEIPDVIVLLFNLAATPEEENHGVVIAKVRNRLEAAASAAQLLLLVDAGPYAVRQAGMGNRLADRRETWRTFIAARGLPLCVVDLSTVNDGASALEEIRLALWCTEPQ